VYIRLLLKKGKIEDVLRLVDEGIPFTTDVGQPLAVIFLLGMKANAQILLMDIKGAEESLKQAEKLVSREKRISPLMISSYLTSRFLLNLYKLKEIIATDEKLKLNQLKKGVLSLGRSSLKNLEKYAAEKTKTLRLMGDYFWLIGKENKAFNWWEKSIKEGEKLNSLPELGRTYLEVGKGLLDSDCGKKELIGISAEEYFEKAHVIFQNLGIECFERESLIC
jgi:hypothetical protein